MKPTIGRIVHYTNLGDADGKYPPEQHPAIITKVKCWHEADLTNIPEESKYAVSLRIFYETGEFSMIDVPFSPEYEPGHWTWPPR